MDLDDDEEEGGIESRGDEMFRVRQAGRHALPDLGRFRYVQVGQAADSERPPGGSVPSEPVLRCRLYKDYQSRRSAKKWACHNQILSCDAAVPRAYCLLCVSIQYDSLRHHRPFCFSFNLPNRLPTTPLAPACAL